MFTTQVQLAQATASTAGTETLPKSLIEQRGSRFLFCLMFELVRQLLSAEACVSHEVWELICGLVADTARSVLSGTPGLFV